MSDLRRTLDNQLKVPGVFVQQRSTSGGGPDMTLKVQVTPNRGVMAIVLQPISRAGIIALDDGRELRTYLPDQRTVLIQASPRLFTQEMDDRMRLIARNYQVSFGRTLSVAGRPARQISLAPRDTRLPARRLTYDRQQFTVLRYEVARGSGMKLLLDTISVKFCEGEAKQGFALPTGRDVREVRSWGPRLVRRGSDARALTGFTPRIPSHLTAGFIVHTTQLVGTEAAPILAVRLTDGMADVTVYQWSPDRFEGKNPIRADNTREDGHGVRFAASGDVSDALLREILDAFAPAR